MKKDGFSYSVVVRDIPIEGRRYAVEADQGERRWLADTLAIPEVLSLAAEIEIRPIRGQAFSVRGNLNAVVVQSDVVTLDPVTQEVHEEIDVTLMPAESAPRARGPELLVDMEEADGPDLYHNGRIDLAVIATEHLALGLDPYPKAPDTAFAGYVEDDPAAAPSPFAALAGLKKDPN
jgi:uncharacterized metal-binding protein YceD (DUF177 family)